MAEIINLRQARKASARAAAAKQAAENRARHGLDKATKQHQRLETERAARTIDGAKREEP